MGVRPTPFSTSKERPRVGVTAGKRVHSSRPVRRQGEEKLRGGFARAGRWVAAVADALWRCPGVVHMVGVDAGGNALTVWE